MIDDLKLYPEIQQVFYPKAGNRNPSIKIAVINVQGGGKKFVDLDQDTSSYYPWFEWYDDENLWIMKLGRMQKKWQMIYADVSNGRIMEGLQESDPNGWVELHETNQILKEKGLFLDFCYENNVFLFFEHDASVELSSLKKTDRGIRLNEKISVLDL